MENSAMVISLFKDIFYIITLALGIYGTVYGIMQKQKSKSEKTLIEKIKEEVTPITTRLDTLEQTTEKTRYRDEATTYCTLALCKNALYNGDAKNDVKESMHNLEKVLNKTA